MLSRIESASRKVNATIVTYLCGSALLLVTCLTVIDASRRTFFGQVFVGMRDVVEILEAWAIFAAFAYALIRGAHVRMTLVVDRIPSGLRSSLEFIGIIVGVGFFLLLTYLTVPYAWHSFLIKEAPMSSVRSPVWLGKMALPVGSALILFEFVLRLIRKVRPAAGVPEGEEEEIRGI